MKVCLRIFSLIVLLLLSCCDKKSSWAKHPLAGAWLASDGSIFHFRDDGTFHGIDLRKREIWGNWVVLSKTRAGFQSLLHKSYYNPQYAVVQSANPDKMDYIMSDANYFIAASHLDPEKAMATIDLATATNLPLPNSTEIAE